MNRLDSKLHRQERRNRRVRKNITGTPERYRLTVFRSSVHIYAQIIDDTTGRTVAQASTVEKAVKAKGAGSVAKIEESKLVGATLAERAKAANATRVAFDRNGFLYHGRVKALAESAREHGLDF
jgi:large subunit ribosomal protein L18